MKSRTQKTPKPSLYQAQILRLIAQSPLMKTYTPERTVIWGLRNGRQISEACANALIRNGWVKPVRDGLGMFDESQTYVALTPPLSATR